MKGNPVQSMVRAIVPIRGIAVAAAFLLLPLVGLAQSDQQFDFDIEAQPLTDALVEFSLATGRQVTADSALLRNQRSTATSGRFSADDALISILQGTGLDARVVNGRNYALRTMEAVSPPPTAARVPAAVDEIIVRGELIDRSLQDTQTSVSVFLGDELDESVDKDLFDVIDRTIGVNAQGGGFGFVIRGIPPGGVGGGSGPTVNVQVDGALLPAVATGPLSTWDLEQVEVLRGPQSTQQGPSSLAGAIQLRTRNPSFAGTEFKARGDFGSFDETRAAVSANLPMNDQWAFRFSAEDFQSDGNIVFLPTGEEAGNESLTTYRGKLRFRPNSQFDAVLSYTFSENELGSQGIDDTQFPERRVTTSINTTFAENNVAALNLGYEFNDRWSVRSETTYLMSDYFIDVPFNGLTSGVRTIDDSTLSQELRLLFSGSDVRGVLGVYYLEREQDLDFEAIVPSANIILPPIPGLPPISAVLGNTFDTKTENIALYGEAEYDFNERWTVVAGFRYDTEEDAGTTANFSVFTPDPLMISSTGEPVTLDSDYSAFLPKGSVIYNFSEEISLSFTAQRAYRAGGAASDLIGNPYEFDPEFTNNYELAFRSVLNGGRFVFNANVFYTDYTDMQVSQPGPSGTFLDTVIENAGAATLWGIEVQSDFVISENFSVFANVGYNSTEFDEYVVVENDIPIDLSGNEFNESPNWTGSIGADYSHPRGWFADVSVNYTDDTFFTTRNLPEQLSDPFTLVNARIGYTPDSWWSVFLYGRNILDEQYLSRKRIDTPSSSTAGDSAVFGASFQVRL